MKQETMLELVEYVRKAQDNRYEIEKITRKLFPKLSIEQAYLLQEELVRQKLARGEKIVGPKMGLTSVAKLKQMHVSDPIYGYVFDSMLIPDKGSINLENYIHPKVEPEIGLVLKHDIKGPNVTREDILDAVEFLFPAIEVIDSRYQNFDFTLPDVIADNTSAAGAVFGSYVQPGKNIDLVSIDVSLQINGKIVGKGIGADVMGHPANSVACLANMLAKKGEIIKAGEPILTGGLTAAVSLSKGDMVQVNFEKELGEVCLFVDV